MHLPSSHSWAGSKRRCMVPTWMPQLASSTATGMQGPTANHSAKDFGWVPILWSVRNASRCALGVGTLYRRWSCPAINNGRLVNTEVLMVWRPSTKEGCNVHSCYRDDVTVYEGEVLYGAHHMCCGPPLPGGRLSQSQPEWMDPSPPYLLRTWVLHVGAAL